MAQPQQPPAQQRQPPHGIPNGVRRQQTRPNGILFTVVENYLKGNWVPFWVSFYKLNLGHAKTNQINQRRRQETDEWLELLRQKKNQLEPNYQDIIDYFETDPPRQKSMHFTHDINGLFYLPNTPAWKDLKTFQLKINSPHIMYPAGFDPRSREFTDQTHLPAEQPWPSQLMKQRFRNSEVYMGFDGIKRGMRWLVIKEMMTVLSLSTPWIVDRFEEDPNVNVGVFDPNNRADPHTRIATLSK